MTNLKKKTETSFDCEISVKEYPAAKLFFAWVSKGGVWLRDSKRIGASGKTEDQAIERLAKLAYGDVTNFVQKRAAYKCERCGGLGPLHVHHKLYRSHAGTHVPANLEAVHPKCHDKIHKKGKSKK